VRCNSNYRFYCYDNCRTLRRTTRLLMNETPGNIRVRRSETIIIVILVARLYEIVRQRQTIMIRTVTYDSNSINLRVFHFSYIIEPRNDVAIPVVRIRDLRAYKRWIVRADELYTVDVSPAAAISRNFVVPPAENILHFGY